MPLGIWNTAMRAYPAERALGEGELLVRLGEPTEVRVQPAVDKNGKPGLMVSGLGDTAMFVPENSWAYALEAVQKAHVNYAEPVA